MKLGTSPAAVPFGNTMYLRLPNQGIHEILAAGCMRHRPSLADLLQVGRIQSQPAGEAQPSGPSLPSRACHLAEEFDHERNLGFFVLIL
jgi:hypothetical protein